MLFDLLILLIVNIQRMLLIKFWNWYFWSGFWNIKAKDNLSKQGSAFAVCFLSVLSIRFHSVLKIFWLHSDSESNLENSCLRKNEEKKIFFFKY